MYIIQKWCYRFNTSLKLSMWASGIEQWKKAAWYMYVHSLPGGLMAPGWTMGRRTAEVSAVLCAMLCREPLGPSSHVDAALTWSTCLTSLHHVLPFMDMIVPDGCELFQSQKPALRFEVEAFKSPKSQSSCALVWCTRHAHESDPRKPFKECPAKILVAYWEAGIPVN